MADERLKFLVQNFGGQYGGAGISSTLKRSVKPDSSKAPQVAQPGVLDKISRVIGQTASVGASVIGAGARFVGNTAVDIAQAGLGTGKTLVDLAVQPLQLVGANRSIDDLNKKEKSVHDDFRAGRLSKDDYAARLKNIRDSRQDINKTLKGISNGPTAQERSEEVVETAVNVLTLGGWSLARSAGKSAAEEVAKKGVQSSLDEAVGIIQNTILKIPAAKELVARNAAVTAKREAQRAAGESMEQYMVREGKRVAIGLLVKRPLFYQQNIQDATNIYSAMTNGDYGSALKSAGWMASQMLSGGPVGWFMTQGKQAGVKLRELSRGRQSFIDKLSAQIGNNNPAQIARYLNTIKEKAPNEYKKSEEIFRVMQETNLRVADERVEDAVENVLRTYDQAGVARENIHPKQFVDDYARWREAAQVADSLKSRTIPGLDEHQTANLVVVRWDSLMKRGLASAIQEVGDNREAMVDVLMDFAGRTGNGWGNNPNLMKQLTRVIDESPSAKSAADRIKSIPTATAMPDGLPKNVQKKLSDLGYGVAVPLGGVRKTPIVKLEDTRKLITAATRGNTDLFDEAVEPIPSLQAVSGALARSGLSPESANKVANDSLRQSLVATLADTSIGRSLGFMQDGDVSKGGAAVLSQLQRYVENKKPVFALGKISSGKSAVTDVRMLRPDEIAEALGVSKADAKEVQGALLDAYTKVPLELRGLGDRAVDYAFKYNPTQKYYARIQSALRYTYNPFFRFQEQVETAILSKMNANKFIWLQPREKLDDGVQQLARAGFFEGNLMSAAADDVVFGRISANMTSFQKRNLAGLAQTVADRKGISLDDMINQYPDELDDALRVVVQYPNKGVLASALARTINIAFFPMRYNAKVSMLAAQKLAELPPSVQLGVLQGFMKTKDWLQSDEGIRWQRQHADAIQVFKWATPVGSIQSFYKVVTGNVESPGDLGLLGGLPFGIISQILDSQGIINLNTPYIDPQTGNQFPDYVPQTARANAAVAVNDLLGSMFSFPGRTLGLPGKEATLRKMVDAFIDTEGVDFEKRYDMENLTPLQKNMIRVLKGDTSDEAINALYTAPGNGQFDYYTLPPFELPERAKRVPGKVNVLTRTEVAARQPQRTQRAERVARPISRPE